MIEAQPLYFGKRHELFGWYHAPQSAHKAGIGVVMVSPNGFDMISMHWGLRRCAEMISASGIPVIRFDLHGTGNSLGDDDQPERVNAWMESINEAIDLLKYQTNVETVVLLGVRLGGTLAAIVTAGRKDVAGLVLYSPCTTGRQYVREVRMLGAAAREAEKVKIIDAGSNDVLMAGWLLTEQTVNDLGKLDISKVSYKDKRVLYIYRDEIGADKKLVSALQSTTPDSIIHSSSDYVEFSQDALFGKEPVNDFKFINEWLLSIPDDIDVASNNSDVDINSYKAELNGPDFIEEPVRFGEGVSMFGIHCRPEKLYSKLCIIFVNTGANHHIGSHRMAVELSRKLASFGIGSFRMDVSGVGDSQVREGRKMNQVYYLPAVEDVKQAIDTVVERGSENVMLAGLCSGGYLAYNTAVEDPRVKVLAIVNLLRFIWRANDTLVGGDNISAASLESYGRKVRQWKTWRRLLSGSINMRYLSRAIGTRMTQSLKSKVSEMFYKLLRPREGSNPVQRNCLAMLGRGTQIKMIYSEEDGGMDEVALYLGSRGKVLNGKHGYCFHEISGADHTFTTKTSRKALLDIYIGCVNKYEANKPTA